jgi:hypothetical protein
MERPRRDVNEKFLEELLELSTHFFEKYKPGNASEAHDVDCRFAESIANPGA